MPKLRFVLTVIACCLALLFAISVMAQNGEKKFQWKDNEKAFVDLVRDGNFESIKKAVSEGANVNSRWSNGVSALRWAIMNCDYETVKLLLDNKAIVPKGDGLLRYCADCGLTPSTGAYVTEQPWKLAEPKKIEDSIKIAKLLLAHGIDMDDTDHKSVGSSTALETAARWGLLEMARFLLDNGARVTEQVMNMAAYSGRKEVAELVFQSIKDINERERAGRSALGYAAGRGNGEVTAFLLEHGAKAGIDDLVGAAGGEDIGALEVLLPKFPDVDAEANSCCHGRPGTALMAAAGNGRIQNMELLLSKGANINKQNSQGETALMLAEYRSQKQAVEFLLKKGADPETGKHFFDPGGYYSPKTELIHSGYKIENIDLYSYIEKKECSLELKTSADQESHWYFTSAPIVRPDLISLVFDSTPIGTIKIEGSFIEKQGHFWDSDMLNGSNVPVAEVTVTISDSKESKKIEHVFLTYFGGD